CPPALSTRIPCTTLFRSPIPLYYQVAQSLKRTIASGELAPGERLANEIDLAATLGVSRPTVRRALRYLVEEGLLVRKPGVGTQRSEEHTSELQSRENLVC